MSDSLFALSSIYKYRPSETNVLNEAKEEIIEVQEPTYKPTITNPTFDLNYTTNNASKGKYLDFRTSYVKVRFSVSDNAQAYATTDQQVFNPCACVAWMNHWTLTINDVEVDGQTRNPEVPMRVKMSYLPEGFLDTYGTMYGLFLHRHNDVAGSIANHELADSTDILILNAAHHTDIYVTFYLPLWLLSDFCGSIALEHCFLPVKNIQFSGERKSVDYGSTGQLLGCVDTATTLHTTVAAAGAGTVDSFTVKLILKFATPSLRDLEAIEAKNKGGYGILYSRFKLLTATLTADESHRQMIDCNSPVKQFVGFYVPTASTGYMSTATANTPNTMWTLSKLTNMTCTLGGIDKPYGKQIFKTTDFSYANHDWAVFYREYLEDLAKSTDHTFKPCVTYDKFQYMPIIVVKLDNKLRGAGEEQKGGHEEIVVESTFASTTGIVYYITEYKAFVQMDKFGNITKSNING